MHRRSEPGTRRSAAMMYLAIIKGLAGRTRCQDANLACKREAAGHRGRSRPLRIGPDTDHGAWSSRCGNPHAYPPICAEVGIEVQI